MRNEKLAEGIWLALVGVSMLLLNLCTFNYSDDYPYTYYLHADGLIDITRRVTGMADIVQSQYHHYLLHNGRVLDNGLVQLFMFIDNRPVFAVCNTLVFVGYVFLLQKVAGRRHWSYTLLITGLLLVLLRAFGEALLWMSGALNYLWGGLFNLLFLYYLQRHQTCQRIRTGLMLLPLSLMAGWWQEAFSVGMAAALCLSVVYDWRQKAPWAKAPLMMAAAYWAGTLLLILAPGTLDRMARDGVDSGYMLSHIGRNILYVFGGLRIFWLAVIIAVIRHFRHQQPLRAFCGGNRLLLLAIAGNMLFLMLLGRVANPRAFFGVETLSLLLVLRMQPSWPRYVTALMAVGTLAVYLFVLNLSWRNYQTMQNFLQELQASGDSENIFFDTPRYTSTQVHYLGSLLEFNHHSEVFTCESAYYHKRVMRVMPAKLRQQLYETASFINPANEWRPGKYSTPEMAFYVEPLPADLPLPPSTEEVEYVSFPSGKYLLADKNDRPRKRAAKRKQ